MPAESNRKILREAIVRVFDPPTLTLTLGEGTPSRNYDEYVSPSAKYGDQVYQLIDRADREGWLLGLIDTLLSARAGNRTFVTTLTPIRERLVQRDTLDDAAADDGSAPSSKRRAFVWLALSLGIIATTAINAFLEGTLPPWTAAQLAVGIMFLTLGLMGLFALGGNAVRGLISFDQRTIPGIGVTGLVLMLVLSAGLVGVVRSYITTHARVPVVVAIQDGTSPLPDLDIFAELLASDQTRPERTRGKTVPPNAEALLKLHPDEFYRFGVSMVRGGTLREGIFPTRIVKDRERIQFDINSILANSWIEPGRNAPVAVVSEDEPGISPNLPAEIATTVQRSRTAQVASPPANPALRADRGPVGLPAAPWIADRRFFTAGYDPQKRRPVFVAFKIDPQTPRVPRNSGIRFEPDPLLPPEVQPSGDDFRGSGYDRGHLVTIGNVRPDEDAVEEAYYLSAVVPQTQESNRRAWSWVEDYTTRAQAALRQPVWVLAGPVYRRTPTGKERVVVLGAGATPVPTDLFRILARRRGSSGWEVQAFLVANDNESSGERDPLRFVTSVGAIEQLTGLTLLPRLPANLRDLVNTTDWRGTPAPASLQ